MATLYKNKQSKFLIFIMSTLFSVSTFSLTVLTDEEMAEISGQASLLSIDKYDYGVNNFYQVKVNSEVETSVNIDHLLLEDSSGVAQIDITDLSIGGGVNNQASVATLTNPFVEFAFAGSIDDTDARTREIIGVRFGADEMTGIMSFGTQHPTNPDLDTGISVISGYMQTNGLSGNANTLAFDSDNDAATYSLTAGLRVIGLFDGNMIIPDAHVQFPSQSANFTTAPVTVNGSYQTNADIVTDIITLDGISYTAEGPGTATVCIPLIFGCGNVVLNPNVQASGTIDNVKARGFITQDLKTIHNISVNDGFYLSAQNREVDWRGSEADDKAQAGWWMGFNGQVQIAPLNLDSVALPSSTVVAILAEVSTELQNNPVSLGLGDVIGGFTGNVAKTINVTLPNDNEGGGGTQNVAPLVLTNQLLGPSQAPIVNCWNGAIGC